MTETIELAQNSEKRKKSIAKAVAAGRIKKTKILGKERLDVYVKKDTKEFLCRIKDEFTDVNNQDEAVDKAVELAKKQIDEES